jgi:hypothetical protein
MREREEGPLEFKRRQTAMSDEPPRPEPPRATSNVTSNVTSNRADPYVRVTTASNGEEVRKLYEQIEREHFKLGKLPPVTIDQLTQMVQKQSEIVRSKYRVNTVAFRIETIDGKVKLKAKPLQEP